jgi:hypothetical protein
MTGLLMTTRKPNHANHVRQRTEMNELRSMMKLLDWTKKKTRQRWSN